MLREFESKSSKDRNQTKRTINTGWGMVHRRSKSVKHFPLKFQSRRWIQVMSTKTQAIIHSHRQEEGEGSREEEEVKIRRDLHWPWTKGEQEDRGTRQDGRRRWRWRRGDGEEQPARRERREPYLSLLLDLIVRMLYIRSQWVKVTKRLRGTFCSPSPFPFFLFPCGLGVSFLAACRGPEPWGLNNHVHSYY